MPENVSRHLAAIVSADVAGYSRLMGEDEAGTLARLTAVRRETVDPRIAEHGGRIVGSSGDGLLLEFPSALAAVDCAIAVQTAMAEREAGEPPQRRMLFRVGINLGDVIAQDNDIFGDGVNIAARLQAMAEPGGLCIGASVYDQVKGRRDHVFRPMGERRLKNIAAPVVVFAWEAGGTARKPASAWPHKKRLRLIAGAATLLALAAALGVWGARPWLERSAPGAPSDRASRENIAGRPVIAVLPFENQTGDAGQEYFSDGLTEDLIAALGRFSNLVVIGRSSVFAFKGKKASSDELARALGVRYLVEGSVRRADGRVRIAVQLTETAGGRLLWSQRYEEAVGDLFALQDRMSGDLAGALTVKLTQIEREYATTKVPQNLQAYDHVLRGRHAMRQRGRSNYLEAQKEFKQAVALAPAYAEARAALGWALFGMAANGYTTQTAQTLSLAEQEAEAARQLEPNLPSAYTLLGQIHVARADYARAAEYFDIATRFNPIDAASYAAKANGLFWSGRIDEALAAYDTALRFDPQMTNPFFSSLIFAYFAKQRYEDAIAASMRMPSKTGGDVIAQIALVAAYALLGRTVEANRAVEELRRTAPFFDRKEFIESFALPALRDKLDEGLRKAGFE